MKKLLALLLSLAMALSLAACGGGETAQQEPGGDAAGETYSFSVGTNTAEDSVNHLLAAKFKELIEDRSDGAVTVTLYENGALGGDAELTESCIAGSVDFIVGMTGSLVNYIPEAALFDLPNVFPDLETAREVLDGPILAELRAAYDLLAQAKEAGVYQAFVMDEVFDKMETGEAAISAYYAGDYLTMLETNPDLKYVVPEEGSNWFVDAMCVLKDAENKDEAEEWINFLCSTDASLKNMDYIWYASPNKEALEQYPEYYEETYGEELDPELYEIMAAPQEVLKNCEAYLVRPAATRTLYNDLWTDLGILA